MRYRFAVGLRLLDLDLRREHLGLHSTECQLDLLDRVHYAVHLHELGRVVVVRFDVDRDLEKKRYCLV